MGGRGSGRPENQNRKETTEQRKSLNVLVWHREGGLAPGTVFEWGHHWWRDACNIEAFSSGLLRDPALRIHVSADWNDEVTVPLAACLKIEHLRMRRQSPEWVEIEWSPCHFGGTRPWLVCPGCKSRREKLYFTQTHNTQTHNTQTRNEPVNHSSEPCHRCRICLGLAYESQRQDAPRRAAEKAKRGRRKAAGLWGALGGLTLPFPERRKGMHWGTYERLRAAAEEAEQEWWVHHEATVTQMQKSFEQITNRMALGQK